MNRIIQSGYYKLTRRLFLSGMKWVLLLCAISSVLTILLLLGSVNQQTFTFAFDTLMTRAGIRYLFLAALFLLVLAMITQIHFDNVKNKGIYTLMMLPMPRRHVLLAYCTVGVAYTLMLWMVQTVSLLAAYVPVVNACRSTGALYAQINATALPFDVARTNGLFLAVIRSDLFRILLPQSIPGLLSSLFVLLGTGCLPACAQFGFSRRYRSQSGFIFLALLWAVHCRFGIVAAGVDTTVFIISTLLLGLIVTMSMVLSIRALNKDANLT